MHLFITLCTYASIGTVPRPDLARCPCPLLLGPIHPTSLHTPAAPAMRAQPRPGRSPRRAPTRSSTPFQAARSSQRPGLSCSELPLPVLPSRQSSLSSMRRLSFWGASLRIWACTRTRKFMLDGTLTQCLYSSFAILIGYLSTIIRAPYSEWADGQIEVGPAGSAWPQ